MSKELQFLFYKTPYENAEVDVLIIIAVRNSTLFCPG